MLELEKLGREGNSIDRIEAVRGNKNYTAHYEELLDWANAHPDGVIETTGTSPRAKNLIQRLTVPYKVCYLACAWSETLRRECDRLDRPPLPDYVFDRTIVVPYNDIYNTTYVHPADTAQGILE